MSGIECSLEDCTPFRDEKALKCHQGILKLFTVTYRWKLSVLAAVEVGWPTYSGLKKLWIVLYSPKYEATSVSSLWLYLFEVSFICQRLLSCLDTVCPLTTVTVCCAGGADVLPEETLWLRRPRRGSVLLSWLRQQAQQPVPGPEWTHTLSQRSVLAVRLPAVPLHGQ